MKKKYARPQGNIWPNPMRTNEEVFAEVDKVVKAFAEKVAKSGFFLCALDSLRTGSRAIEIIR